MSFLTDSIIISSEKRIDITIHINIFLPSDKEECYFEMGVLAHCQDKNEEKTPTIEILLPIESNKFQFEDLSDRFIDNPDYLRLIFNQSSSIDKKNREFEIDDRKVIFGKIDNKGNNISNSKITLEFGEDKTKDHYFRFRLKKIKKERLCLEKETTSFTIDPFKRFINVSGFHVNNIRNDKNEQLNSVKNQISIQEINTFFICDTTAILIDSSTPKRSFRLLEENIWEEYISDDKDKIDDSQKRIVYQFKKMAIENAKNIDNSKAKKRLTMMQRILMFLKLKETDNKNTENIDKQNVACQIKDFKLFVKTSHIDKSMPIRFLITIILIAISANALHGVLRLQFSDLEILSFIIILFTLFTVSNVLYECGFISCLSTKLKSLLRSMK